MFHREQLAKEPYRSESNAMDHKAGAGHIFSTPEQNRSLSPYSIFLWLFFLLLWEERITLYTHSRELFPAEITVFNTHRTWENVYNFMGKCLGGPMFWPIQEGWKLTSPPQSGSGVGAVGGLGRTMCSAGAPYLFDGRHLDVLIVVQRRIGWTHVIAKPSYRHLITVVQRHGYCYASQGGDVLRGEKAGMEVISRLPFI